MDHVSDVVLFPYDPGDLDRFMGEIKAETASRFQPSSVDICTVSPLHLLSLFDPWPGEDEARRGRQAGRSLSDRLTVSDGDSVEEAEFETDVVAETALGRAYA